MDYVPGNDPISGPSCNSNLSVPTLGYKGLGGNKDVTPKTSKKSKSQKRRERLAAKKNSEKGARGSRSNRTSRTKKTKSFWHSVKQPYFGHVSSDWYWTNYTKALNWRDRYEIDKWKARVKALEEENMHYRQIIQSLQGRSEWGPCQRTEGQLFFTNPFPSSRHQNSLLSEDLKEEPEDEEDIDEGNCENNEDSITFEMSDEMIKFFQESFKHKMDLKKEKKQEEDRIEVDKKVMELQFTKLRRVSEMKLLYGDDAPKIIGMETAVQLSFNKYCDMKGPKYWPNIPLNL
ncbi:hypothetical protein RUM44_013843 [Polyplax serrata]|uniref:Gem-associated protein 8 n=1 Tax=Polyplax serrata TaxID=468196 RepID=A0ABR1BFA3_POLSC